MLKNVEEINKVSCSHDCNDIVTIYLLFSYRPRAQLPLINSQWTDCAPEVNYTLRR